MLPNKRSAKSEFREPASEAASETTSETTSEATSEASEASEAASEWSCTDCEQIEQNEWNHRRSPYLLVFTAANCNAQLAAAYLNQLAAND